MTLHRRLRQQLFQLTLLVVLTWTTPGLAANKLKAMVGSSGANLYMKPDKNSQVIGQYSPGTMITVNPQTKNGFYYFYLPQLWHGTHYVWVPEDSIEVKEETQEESEENDVSEAVFLYNAYRDSIRAGAMINLFNPSAVQTTLGDSSSLIYGFSFNLEYEHLFTRSWAGLVQFSRFSFTQSLQKYSNSSLTYSSTGYALTVAPVFYITNKKNFTFSIAAGGGISFDTAGNSAQTNSISSGGIVSFPLFVQFTALQRIGQGWGIFLRWGGKYEVLSGVALISEPYGTPATSADFNLTSFFGGLGVSYDF